MNFYSFQMVIKKKKSAVLLGIGSHGVVILDTERPSVIIQEIEHHNISEVVNEGAMLTICSYAVC